jgi:hypothetical protein
MRKLLAIIVLLFPLLLHASSPGIQWDVRSTGNDANGGGFVPTVTSPGTDGSQIAPVSCSIILSGTGTTGTSAGPCTFSSTTNGPGNVINITSGTGCTVNRVYILSQSAGTATFNISAGSAASVCTGTLGGSMLTIDAVTAILNANSVNTNGSSYIWVQGPTTYTETSALNFTISANPTCIGGFQTTHGDIPPSHANDANRPTITTATNSTKLFTPSNAQPNCFQNLILTNTASTRAAGIYCAGGGDSPLIDNVLFSGFSIAVDGHNGGNCRNLIITNSEIKNSTADCVHNDGSNTTILWTYIHDNTAAGSTGCVMQDGSVQGIIMNHVVIADTSGIGFWMNANASICSISNSAIVRSSGDNMHFESGGNMVILENVIDFGSTAGFGVHVVNALESYTSYNIALGSNFSGDYSTGLGGTNLLPTTIVGSITLGVSPFVSTTNFALNTTANGGALLAAAGFPVTLPGSVGSNYGDDNVVQSQGSSGATGPYGYVQ